MIIWSHQSRLNLIPEKRMIKVMKVSSSRKSNRTQGFADFRVVNMWNVRNVKELMIDLFSRARQVGRHVICFVSFCIILLPDLSIETSNYRTTISKNLGKVRYMWQIVPIIRWYVWSPSIMHRVSDIKHRVRGDIRIHNSLGGTEERREPKKDFFWILEYGVCDESLEGGPVVTWGNRIGSRKMPFNHHHQVNEIFTLLRTG